MARSFINVEITGNGDIEVNLPEWYEKSFVFPRGSFGGASVQLKLHDQLLLDGVLTEGGQYKVEHGRNCKMVLVVSGFTAPFSVTIAGA